MKNIDKKTVLIYCLFIILCILFGIHQATLSYDMSRESEFGTSRDATVELSTESEISCVFKPLYDNLQGLSVRFQSEARFHEEEVQAVLYDALTNEILAEDKVEMKYERIQNKDGGSSMYFFLPVKGIKDREVKVVFSLVGYSDGASPLFVLSNSMLNESSLWINGLRSEKNLVFSARYLLGKKRDIAGAVVQSLLWISIGTLIYVFYILNNRKLKGYNFNGVSETSSVSFYEKVVKRISEGWARKWKLYGYLMLVLTLLFLIVYVYQYNVEVSMIENKIWELKKLYIGLSILLFLFGTMVYVSVYVKPLSIERQFVVVAVPLGIIFGLIIGLNTVPDEPSHIDTAYALSNELLGILESKKPGYIYKRASDVDVYTEEKQQLNAESYRYLAQEFFRKSEDETLVEVAARSNLENAGKIYYIPQALGISLGRLLGLGMMQTMLLGRLFSLLMYIVLVYFAIKAIPFAKITLLIVAILPISMQQAASFSYDAVINAVAFLYTAFCLKAAYGRSELQTWDIGVIAVTGSLICSVKGGVYVALCLLPVIIMSKARKSGNQKWIGIALIGISTASFVITNLLKTLSHFAAKAGTVIGGAANAEIYTFSYFLRYPHRFIGMFVNTFYKQGDSYIRNLFGGNLAWRDINISWFIVIGFMVILFFSCLSDKWESEVKKEHKILFGIISFASFFCVEVSMLLVWTTKNLNYITGVQGRYFLPFFILILLTMRTSFLKIKRNIDKGLIFCAGMLNIITILQVVQRALGR